jgi:hypothetical protein
MTRLYSLSLEKSLDIVDKALSDTFLPQVLPGLPLRLHWTGIGIVNRLGIGRATKLL